MDVTCSTSYASTWPSIDEHGDAVFDREFFRAYASLVNSQEYEAAAGSDKELPRYMHATHGAEELARQVHDALCAIGACIVHFGSDYEFESTIPWQETMFGRIMPDSTGRSISRISVTAGQRYYAGSAFGQPMHSDDAHLITGPRVIGLYCSRPADKGGLTTLAFVGEAVNHLDGELPESCFHGTALKLFGSAGMVERSLFTREEDQVLCAFPSILRELRTSTPVAQVYKQVMNWIHQPYNQVRIQLKRGDLLLVDNLRVLHGRTSFSPEQPRLLYRTAFDGLEWRTQQYPQL